MHTYTDERVPFSGANQDTHGLTEFLKLLLAESINSQDKTLSAQIREVQRCLAIFDAKGYVFTSVTDSESVLQRPKAATNVEGRSSATYVVRSLLATLAHYPAPAELLPWQIEQSNPTVTILIVQQPAFSLLLFREKALTNECLIEVLVRFYLEKNEQFLRRFIHEFQLLKANVRKVGRTQ